MAILGFGSHDASSEMEAIGASQAVIKFTLEGIILDANANFCQALGYDLKEIVGKHHSMFVDPDYAKSQEYRDFWANLKSGKFDRRQYKRFGKGGKMLWIEASYNPVLKNGKPVKVIKIATDITEAKHQALEDASKLDAISRSQAVIEFTPAGIILNANDNFCGALGYGRDEIVGKHHSMFCDRDYVKTEDYRIFWQRLANGEFFSNEYVRFSKTGAAVWIQAAYNPIFDDAGKVTKVVKFATDVSQRMNAVDKLGSAISQIAHGNLTASIDQPLVPSMEKIRNDFNAAAAKLRSTVQGILENAGVISNNAQHLQDASGTIAKRTEQQAASVEETAAALEEVTTTVADSSQRAVEAGQLVVATRIAAEKSGQVVQTAIQAMERIENSSKEISNIIGVIDEIAFQTNLLALNAGVEAARAGESGKGFAVVAQEVRELAQRSAKAAKEIKALINISSQQVDTGVTLVNQTGVALTEIVGQVARIDHNVSAIVDAAKQQAIGLKEINSAVNLIDQGTQQNAAMVEESNAASDTLANEVQSLIDQLRQFQVDNDLDHHGGTHSRHAPRLSVVH
ncbi:PAS domain-containing methyl-accepting chemotaxis protein [Rhizobium sp. KVB221]|uniref:PAS domain-containing methyl-accepting chemotaxis protein n=1 Tax=Rhizobium setariae TaxID=2801340 RepID=A0A937CLT6_9HYPH|nr:PAS domain-containing methyl-accepting chemotaxis protein [Rhizobium setariae]MBL0372021.1 PAS domain-containing methyl-accepting chemotaxis protein [Rhizobium setariae]